MGQVAASPTSPSPAPRVKPAGLRLTARRGPSLSPLKGGEEILAIARYSASTTGSGSDSPALAGEGRGNGLAAAGSQKRSRIEAAAKRQL